MGKRLTTAPKGNLYHEISESVFTAQVIAMAQRLGWMVAHFRPAMTAKGWRTAVQGDGAGFPDLVLARGNEVIFAELKSKNGKVSGEQLDWLTTLEMSGRCYVWRPSDIEAIEYILKRKKPGQ